ncbi:spirocyclase AveC family protein [Mycolicibacterium holsaticum]|jgi:hypothetical protein|uniref:spirocyclase AveC family protein n=1 Tax=Mycolicibacterium holsaticum TaxID=152142 RepID=UPI000A04C2F4|nr:spirocyclase AveC family protein [Mycolicibacterium holsaticum]QZA11626.1 spirocyclase AveC family protein [Mycolicibacterium holsaticum DSM 44478 = JCM 12374]
MTASPRHGVEVRGGRFRAAALAWPILGGVSLVFAVVTIGRWLAGGVSSVKPGDDPMPFAKQLLMHVLEWGQFTAFVVIFGWVVVRPLIQRRPLGFDGLFVIAALALNFWDVLDNYWLFAFQYNAHHLNVGSWGGYLPGWQSPEPQLWVVPLGFVFGAYTWAFFLAVTAGCRLLSYVRDKHPSWGPVGGYALVYLCNMAIAAVAENVYLRIGAIANIHPWQALTLWDGTPNAFPLYNPFMFAAVWTVLTALRWSLDQNGLTFVERGLPMMGARAQPATFLRFLAIFAFLEVTYILLYFLPFNLFAILRNVPPNVVPSYFPVP